MTDARSKGAPQNAPRLPGAGPTILVVDDDLLLRRLFSEILNDAGMRVLEAADGRAALDVLHTERVDAVLLDSQMPHLDGLAVLASVRADPSTHTLPVILVTGQSDTEDRVRGLEAGANDYLAKPVDTDELVARVRAQLRGQAAWLRIIDERLRERTDVAEALCRIRPQATPELSAQRVCTVLLGGLRDAAGAAVVVFEPLTGASLLAALDSSGAAPFRPLPTEVATYIRERAQQGPWLEDAAGPAGEAVLFGATRGAAFAPMHSGGRLLGVLVIAAGEGDGARAGGTSNTLSAAIDYAPVTAALLAPALEDRRREQYARAGVRELLDPGAFRTVFQPIVDLGDRSAVGYEVLTRFGDGTPPNLRFAEAARAGMGLELESATMSAALRHAERLPDDVFLSLNVSPAFVADSERLGAVLGDTGRQIVLELTEHDPIEDYEAVRTALRTLGANVQVSVDDAGAGYASLHHILALEPQYVKLDRGWVSGIDQDPAREALVAALGSFAGRLGCTLIAEGIETEAEAAALQVLEVPLGQGWLLGRPMEHAKL